MNPADLPLRGAPLTRVKEWWNGPEWLCHPEEEWPTDNNPLPMDNEGTDILELFIKDSNSEISGVTPLMDTSRFSSLTRLMRATAWVQRAAFRFKRIAVQEDCLTAEEICWAEKRLIRDAQQRGFTAEVNDLRNGKSLAKKSPLRNFICRLDDDGILRIKSWLTSDEDPADLLTPIILPFDNDFTRLLITSTHIRLRHAGLLGTLTELRTRFWILRGRQQIKKAIAACMACKRIAKPLATAQVGPLPQERSQFRQAFEITGIDFAGPLLVKTGQTGDTKKSYIALFTCAVTRAVHLELVSDLTTASFLLSFRRFISRRGICSKIYTDNALTFKRADKDLTRMGQLYNSTQVKDFMASLKVEWKFIIERAPWWGGFWERLVQSVKGSLKRTLGKNLFTFEELTTILTEIEAVINSRPLTAISDQFDGVSALTPAHFLTGQRLTQLPDLDATHPIPGSKTIGELKKRFRIREQCLSHLAKRWKQEYILQLQSAHTGNKKAQPIVQEGDLVLFSKENTPRHCWPLARIKCLHPGRDGCIRSGILQLPNGSTIRRPIALMVPLELLDSTLEWQPLLSWRGVLRNICN